MINLSGAALQLLGVGFHFSRRRSGLGNCRWDATSFESGGNRQFLPKSHSCCQRDSGNGLCRRWNSLSFPLLDQKVREKIHIPTFFCLDCNLESISWDNRRFVKQLQILDDVFLKLLLDVQNLDSANTTWSLKSLAN